MGELGKELLFIVAVVGFAVLQFTSIRRLHRDEKALRDYRDPDYHDPERKS